MTGLQRAVLRALASSDVHDLTSLNKEIFERDANSTTRARIESALNELSRKRFAAPAAAEHNAWVATDKGRKHA